jgi:hypothetical protein
MLKTSVLVLVLVAAIAGGGCESSGGASRGASGSDDSAVAKVVGVYENAAAPSEELHIYEDGTWAIWPMCSVPGYTNNITGKWTPANNAYRFLGPNGDVTIAMAGNVATLELRVTRPEDSSFFRDILAQTGCPDVTDVKYRGAFQLPVGAVFRATLDLTRPQRVLMATASGSDSTPVAYHYRRPVNDDDGNR